MHLVKNFNLSINLKIQGLQADEVTLKGVNASKSQPVLHKVEQIESPTSEGVGLSMFSKSPQNGETEAAKPEPKKEMIILQSRVYYNPYMQEPQKQSDEHNSDIEDAKYAKVEFDDFINFQQNLSFSRF